MRGRSEDRAEWTWLVHEHGPQRERSSAKRIGRKAASFYPWAIFLAFSTAMSMLPTM